MGICSIKDLDIWSCYRDGPVLWPCYGNNKEAKRKKGETDKKTMMEVSRQIATSLSAGCGKLPSV